MADYFLKGLGSYIGKTSLDALRLYFRPLKRLVDFTDSPEFTEMHYSGLKGSVKLFFYPLTCLAKKGLETKI